MIHIPAIAHEFGIEITGDTFDRLHRNARYLLDVRPAGRWPAECLLYKRYQLNLTREDIIRPYDKAIGTDGSIAILRGNLAPEGAVIKHTACPKGVMGLFNRHAVSPMRGVYLE